MPPRRPVGFHSGSMPRGEATRQMASSERRGRSPVGIYAD